MEYISLKKAVKILIGEKKSCSRGYLSLLARQGELKAIKIGVEWATTRDWLRQFLENQNAKCRVQSEKVNRKINRVDSIYLPNQALKNRLLICDPEETIISKRKRSLVLSLYFGWGLELSLIRLQRAVLWPFKKHWQEAIALILLVAVVSSSLFFYQTPEIKAATYTWVQTDWSGGASSTATAVHPANQTSWDLYYSASTTELSIGTGITLAATASSTTQTSDSDFNAGSFSYATTTGSGDTADLELTDWSTCSGGTDHGGADWTPTSTISGVHCNIGIFTISTDTTIDTGSGSILRVYASTSTILGTLSADAKGYAGGQSAKPLACGDGCQDGDGSGTGRGEGSDMEAGGGGYGGTGGDGDVAAPNYCGVGNGGPIYGSSTQPAYLGSGGGGGRDTGGVCGQYGWGGDGGGAIFIKVNQTLTINGTTTANGENGIFCGSGGGSGGSVFLIADTFEGDGSIHANGGRGEDGGSCDGGGGGGGRIAFYYSTATFTGTTTADGGSGYNNGQAGTIYQSTSTPSYPYDATGIFISSAIDVEQDSDFTTLTWSASTTTSTTLKFQLRSADSTTSLESATWYGPTDAGDYYTSSGTTINSTHDGYRYIQYQATLETSDTSETPSLHDVTINYQTYPALAILTSSPYDTNDVANILAGIKWTENLPSASTTLKFQLRTATSSDGIWTDWWGSTATDTDYFTNTATGCSTSTAGEGIEVDCTTIPNELGDALSDQWVQYKAILETTNTAQKPTLYDTTLTYVVNGPPEFDVTYGTNGIDVATTSSAQIDVSYKVRDIDTDQGSPANQWKAWPSFEYSLNGGGSWNIISTSTLSGPDLDDPVDLGPATSTWISTTTFWDAKSQIPENYSTNTQIKITIDDNEAANNTATSASAVFTLDTKNPTLGAIPISVNATSSPASLTLSASDEGSLEMKISLNSDLSGASWQSYNSTSSITLAVDPDTVYVQFKDSYNNTTTIQSVITPTTPSNIFFQDTSNPETSEWREFVAWSVVPQPDPGFGSYNVYRSTDGTNYSLLSSSTDRLVNYVVDTGLSSTTEYYYKITTEDSDGNISYFSSVVSDAPDGTGGSDLASPNISSVATSSITTDSITVTWTTDELSNSTVGYSTSQGVFAIEQGVPSMATSHSVTLTGLSPDTTYYFQAKSADSSGNTGTDNNGGPGYSFTTDPGPVVSNVSVVEVTNFTVTISWITNISADSYLIYSTSSDLSGSQSYGSDTLITAHSVTLTGLSQGTKYYFYVRSTDASSNIAYDKNVIDGIVNYYSLNTTQDATGPVISNISTTVGYDTCTITWETNELSTSQVEYGLTNAYGSQSTENATLTIQHAVTLSSLSQKTTYHFRVKSIDANSNETTGTDNTFATLSPETVTVYIGGGGGAVIDSWPPGISEVKVSNITQTSALISWKSNESGNSLVSYGLTSKYGLLGGNHQEETRIHEVVLVDLKQRATYHFQVISYDSSGNAGKSSDYNFTTLGIGEIPEIVIPEELPEEEKGIVEKIVDFLSRLTSPQSLSSVSSVLEESANRIVGPPLIAGEYPKVEVGPSWAKLTWITDKSSNSLVAFAAKEDYDPTKDEPYVIVSGNPDERITTHIVKLTGLKSSTVYHYQVRSQAQLGDLAKSTDQTFTTLSLFPEISEIKFTSIAENSATLSWETTVPTKTKIEAIDIGTGEKTIQEDPSYLREHQFEVKDLKISTSYSLQIFAEDEGGNISSSSILPFTTAISLEPPVISQVRVTTALIPGRVERVQSLISWKTDKPATSKIFYGEGITTKEELALSTPLDPALVLDHLVVTAAFKPGKIYQFKAESIDAFDNKSYSKDFTILTPRPSETVLDLMIKNFEETFEFLQRIRF